MAILEYGNALNSAPNPMTGTIQAAGQMQGLLQNQQAFEDQQQDRMAQQQAAQNQQALNNEAADLMLSDDYDSQAKFMIKNPNMRKQLIEAMNFKDDSAKSDRVDFNKKVIASSADPRPMLQARIEKVEANGGDTENLRDTLNLGTNDEIRSELMKELSFLDSDAVENYNKAMGLGGESSLPAETLGFNELIKDFTPEQQRKAKEIKAGLKGRAMSNAVLSAIESGDVNNLADANAVIGEAKKFAEATGATRARIIDKGFSKIEKINSALGNIDRAIEAVDAGAGVGALEKKFPSIKAASVALDQIQGEMTLDVLNAATFGALSEGELALAKSIALPTGLNNKELKSHLVNKKAAQEKLRDYFDEQIQFLEQGGTVAGFLRMKKRQSKSPVIQNPQPQAQTQQNNVINWSDL